MRHISSNDAETCIQTLRAGLDQDYAFDQDRFTGWISKGYFRISFRARTTLLRRFYPISCTAFGTLRETEAGTVLTFRLYYGLTDPAALALIFLIALVFFFIVRVPNPVLLSFALAFGIGVYTYFSSRYTPTGRRGYEELQAYITKL